MLQAFANQTDVPEALREHYSKREDSQWHADIPDTHPAVKHNAKLLSEKQTAEGKVTQLTSDLESARAGNLGRGQVAITKSELALLDEFKALNLPVADIKTKLSEHESMKADLDKRKRDDSLRHLAKDMQFNEEAFVRLPNLPEFESRAGKEGKTEWIAKIKDDKGVITEKPAKEFIDSSPDIQPFAAALKAVNQSVKVPGSSMTVNPPASDPFAWAKEFGKNWNEQNKPAGDLAASFGIGK